MVLVVTVRLPSPPTAAQLTANDVDAVPPAGTALTGTFRPEMVFLRGAFRYLDAAGAWTLKVVDDSAGDVGTLNSWSLNVIATHSQPMVIPDNTSAGAVTSIVVPTAAGIIKDLDISLSITHTFNADLDVSLTHVPSGITLFLFTDVNGGGDGMNLRLSDEAATAIEAATIPPAGTQLKGTFKPETPALLHAFDGLDASGEWQLKVVDDSAGDIGQLIGWALHFTF